MFLTRKHLSRRALLKGMGATMALPLLDAMTPAFGMVEPKGSTPPVRLVCIEMVHGAAGSAPFGHDNNLWAPAAEGRTFDLGPTSLKPLEPFRDYLTIVSNTDVPSANATTAREIGGDHFRSTAVFLTQSYPKRTDGPDVEAGTSLDQLYAQRFGQDTPIPSLQVCIEDVDQAGGCQYGYSCKYVDSLSWASPHKPLPMVRDPRVVFDQLFGMFAKGGSPAERGERLAEDRSILDWLMASSSRLQSRLGAADRVRLNEYLDNVREIERRIQNIEAFNRTGEPRELPDAPAGVPDSFAAHVKVMFDLQLLAFASDVTRVVSFKLSRDGSNRVYPESGFTGAFHLASHHSGREERIKDFARLNTYHVSMLPYFLKKLKSTPDGDGNLLENSLVLYGSPMGDPNMHNHKRVPFFVAGRAGGALKGGVHLKAPSRTPLSNVMLSLLHALGMDDLTSFGDSEGTFAILMIRYALRSIARMPGLASVVILSLGVGIGVNTAVFSWIQAIVLKPLPAVPNATSFFSVEPKANTGTYPGVSWREYGDFKERLRGFQDVLAFRMVPFSVGESSRTERAYGMLVSGNYFSVLNLKPALGRFLEPREAAQPGGEPVVVISHDYWQTHFAGRTDVVGQSIRVNERPLTIIGVAPETFQGTITGLQFDLFVPATMAPSLLAGSNELENRNLRGYQVMGLLRGDVSQPQAQTELTATMAELARAYPESNADMQGEVKSFGSAPRGPQRMLATGLYALQGMMLLVLLAVCGNTANLVLARASSRYREIGVRLALGAGPGRVIRLMIVENIVLALLGSALGVLIAIWGTQALRAMPAYGALPLKFQTSVDLMGLAFAIGLGLVSGLLFGLAPALQLARVDPQQALRAGSRSSGRSAMRDALMGLQVALALLVLVVAGLFFRSFVETRELDPGFRAEGVLLAAYDLTGRSTDDSLARTFATRLIERLRALPSVEAAAIASNVPLDIHGLPARGFTLEGRATSRNEPDLSLSNIVTSGYFKAMGIAFVAGHDFVELADTTMAPQVIVNEEFVRRFLDGGEPLGRRLDNGGRTYVIAGVVRNSTYEAFGEPPTPAMYFGFRDRPRNVGEIHLRTRPGTESVLGAEVQAVVRDLDPTLPVYNIRTLTEHIDKNLILRKVPARLFVVVAPLLLALVSIGIYSVVAYAVSQRTSEIGVRLALGATAERIVRQILLESLAVIAFGLGCGWVLAFMIDIHLIRGGAADAPVLIGVPLLLMAVAAFSCWLPARRATLVDPVVALRQE